MYALVPESGQDQAEPGDIPLPQGGEFRGGNQNPNHNRPRAERAFKI